MNHKLELLSFKKIYTKWGVMPKQRTVQYARSQLSWKADTSNTLSKAKWLKMASIQFTVFLFGYHLSFRCNAERVPCCLLKKNYHILLTVLKLPFAHTL